MDRWPAEAIETIMDRGAACDWRRLAEVIRQNPWGPTARTAEEVAEWGEHYGVDALIKRVVHHARAEIIRRGREQYAKQIRSWRAETGMTAREFAEAAGTSAPRLSAYENARVAPTTDVLGRLHNVAIANKRSRSNLGSKLSATREQ
jgi:DNA-binding transcriptional regulator YiaG